MTTPRNLSRRSMLQLGVVGGVGALGGTLLAATPADPKCATPLQIQGPFYPKRAQPDTDADLTLIQGRSERAEGDVITIRGQVLDDQLHPIPDALVEIWQANAHGRYHHEDDPNTAPEDPAFQGWGQVRTDAEGRYGFRTIVPGPYPVDGEWWRPPHIHFKVAKRGYHELVTQMYFAGHELNAKDALLLAVPEEDRGRLVVALTEGVLEDEPGTRHGTFNIVLQRVARTPPGTHP
jgi:protocatechuate 3,4-dioxygenase, beta subunit